jgi:release factor glutamine methyltransferase
MTINEAYRSAIARLNADFIDNPGIEAELLITDVLKTDRKGFLMEKDASEMGRKQLGKLERRIARRLDGESISSITGRKYFYDDEFFVDQNVLIPRPETELIIDIVLKIYGKESVIDILDIGTGSGIIAAVCSAHLPFSKIDAIDKSGKALKTALRNIRNKKITNINLKKTDFFKFIPEKKYDLIVSNPPYIPSFEVDRLLKYKNISDPRISLDGGKDGLDFYRHLSLFSGEFLKIGGFLIMEHGAGQRNSIAGMFDPAVYEIEFYDDLSGIDRVLKIKKIK